MVTISFTTARCVARDIETLSLTIARHAMQRAAIMEISLCVTSQDTHHIDAFYILKYAQVISHMIIFAHYHMYVA